MKIAVVGMGPAGAYLSALLADNYDIEVFEMQNKETFSSICAWGTGYYKMKELLKDVGLNFDDYVIHKGKELYVNLKNKVFTVKLYGLSTFDKPKLLKDLVSKVKVNYGKCIRSHAVREAFELVIDATGIYRALLPPVEGKDFIIPTVQYLVKFKHPPFDDFYVKPFKSYSGYLWFFPLDNGYAHVGAGDARYGKYVYEVLAFIKRYNGEVVRKMGRPLRLTPPSLATPHYINNIIGVGESVGTVFPLLGEGILPSMMAAKLLKDNIDQPKRYSEILKSRFKRFEDAFRFIKLKMEERNLIHLTLLALKLHRYFKANRDHTGVDPSILDTLKVLKPF